MVTIFIWLGSNSMKLCSAQIIGTSTKAYSKVHLKPLERHSWSYCFEECPIHVFISLSLKGCMRIAGREDTKVALTEGLKAPGTQADLEAALWWEAGFTISDSVPQAGVCFFWPQQMISHGPELQWLDLGQKLSSVRALTPFTVLWNKDLKSLLYFFRESVFLFLLS